MSTRFIEAYRAAAAVKARECAANRALVLRHPDIAARLKEPPYQASRPDVWTGYIPGPLASEDSRGRVAINNSPVRAQLLALVLAAAERDEAEQHARQNNPEGA